MLQGEETNRICPSPWPKTPKVSIASQLHTICPDAPWMRWLQATSTLLTRINLPCLHLTAATKGHQEPQRLFRLQLLHGSKEIILNEVGLCTANLQRLHGLARISQPWPSLSETMARMPERPASFSGTAASPDMDLVGEFRRRGDFWLVPGAWITKPIPLQGLTKCTHPNLFQDI